MTTKRTRTKLTKCTKYSIELTLMLLNSTCVWYNSLKYSIKPTKNMTEGDKMNDDTMNKCCFLGHRKITETAELINNLTVLIESLIIENGVDTFLFGSKSQFDDLCYEIVSTLKEKHTHLKRVYVRAEYADIDESYTDYLLGKYEETYFPEKIRNAGKASYVKRNQEMIDKSDVCIFYYDENYELPQRKASQNDVTSYKPNSGTEIAYSYATKKNKEVINLTK